MNKPSLMLLSILPLALAACSQPTAPPPSPIIQAAPAQISQYIRRMFQDKAGNIWFGTNDEGVCRYDGHSLKYFSTAEGLAGSAVIDRMSGEADGIDAGSAPFRFGDHNHLPA